MAPPYKCPDFSNTPERSQFQEIFMACDQVVNTLFCGKCDETLSARVFREDRKWLVRIIDAIFFWQKDHCAQSFCWEQQRKDLPKEYGK